MRQGSHLRGGGRRNHEKFEEGNKSLEKVCGSDWDSELTREV